MGLQQAAQSDGLITTTAVVSDKPCKFNSLQLVSDGTNVGTIVLYDNASEASGTVIAKLTYPASLVGTVNFTPPREINCSNGIWAVITTCGCIVSYLPGRSA